MTILKTVSKKLRNRNYSERTIETYIHYIGKFLEDVEISDPYQVRLSEIKYYLENRSYSSISQQNQIIAAKRRISIIPQVRVKIGL